MGLLGLMECQCSITIDQIEENKQGPRKRKRGTRPRTDYFQDHIAELKHKMVFIDPNRRDLLYCLGSNKKKLRYTSVQRRFETKAELHEKIRTDIEVEAGLRQRINQRSYHRIPMVHLPSS